MQSAIYRDYTIVPAVVLKEDLSHKAINIIEGKLTQAKLKEKQWLDHAMILLEKEQVKEGDIIAWSPYHASQENISDYAQPAVTQLLPLFYEKAATAAMIKHGMNVLKKATQFLNPGHVSVIALDAPLYALAKLVQWNHLLTHGEKEFVVVSILKWLSGRHLVTI